MRHEAEIRAAILAEFGDSVEYRRPWWGYGIRDELEALNVAANAGRNFAVLVPGRTETAWCQDLCFPWETRCIRGRVVMDGYTAGAPFPSLLIVMGPVARRGEWIWWGPPPAQLQLEPAA